ncbi:MAG: hypothetical protein IPN90_07270 [Elusimicrobia bacterium]|nr:hypothetical protein [Elusimicrobiota bacterium]
MELETIYSNSGMMFSVLKDKESEKHFLEVVCGTIGMYEVTIPLTREEVLDFKIDPSRIHRLVKAVIDNPSEIKKERVGGHA